MRPPCCPNTPFWTSPKHDAWDALRRLGNAQAQAQAQSHNPTSRCRLCSALLCSARNAKTTHHTAGCTCRVPLRNTRTSPWAARTKAPQFSACRIRSHASQKGCGMTCRVSVATQFAAKVAVLKSRFVLARATICKSVDWVRRRFLMFERALFFLLAAVVVA